MLTVRAKRFRSNVAVTVLAALMVTVHVAPETVSHPLQPTNVDRPSARRRQGHAGADCRRVSEQSRAAADPRRTGAHAARAGACPDDRQRVTLHAP